MKTLLATIILAGLLSCQSSKPGFRSVSVDDFQHLIADSSVIRLDVRTAKEFDEGHIPNAVNIDVLQPDFLQKALSSLPRKRTIAVNCRSGKRSKKAAELLAKKGYKVVELDAGFNGWTEEGKEVTKE